MDSIDFFKQYKDILLDGIDKIKKSGFRKLSIFKDMIDTIEVFINKQAYGRIVPGNFLILFILLMGTRNIKIIEICLRTMQKLFSYNYIHEHEQLSVNLLKDDFKEFLLVDVGTLKSKPVSEIYLEVLMQLQQKDQGIILLIIKNLSLVIRLFQHSLQEGVIKNVFYYLVDLLVNRPGNIERTIKSTIIQIVRHLVENLREMEFNVLTQNDGWCVKKICNDQLTSIVDQVVLRQAASQKYDDVEIWKLIPSGEDFNDFKFYKVEATNQKNQPNGKFGWCTQCRQPANYYCKNFRIPVCSFACKNKYFSENQAFDKLYSDEQRAQQNFLIHAKMIIRCLAQELLHSQQRRRVLAIQIVNFVLSEPKRFKSMKNYIREELSILFRQCLINVVSESEAYMGCLQTLKKLIQIGSFLSEVELFFEMACTKLVSIQMPADLKMEMLKCLKDILLNDVVIELFVSLDCQLTRKNSIQQVLKTIFSLSKGVPVPQGITFEEDGRVKRLAYDILLDLMSSLKEMTKKMEPFDQNGQLAQNKLTKKQLDQLMVTFNMKDEKPQKILKKMSKLGALDLNPDSVAKFLHKNMDTLSSVKIGQMVGSHSELSVEVLEHFNKYIEFTNMQVDIGLRHLLDHFTLPGESQQVDRIIDSFSKKFYKDNKNSVFAQAGPVYSLSFLLMMLQTNLHNPQVHEKMKIADVVKLAKGMNQKQDFPLEYLQSLYNSVQRNQLGFHEKAKQKDFVAAFVQGGRKVQEMYQKDLEKMVKRVYAQFKMFSGQPNNDYKPKQACLPLLLDMASKFIIDLLISTLDSTDEQKIVNDVMGILEAIIICCIDNKVKSGSELIVEQVGRRVPDDLPLNKFLITQSILEWSYKYSEHLEKSWKWVFTVLSKFNRKKAIIKSKQNKKPLVIMNDKMSLQEGWLQQLFMRSGQLPQNCVISMLQSLLDVSREEIKDGEMIFCLQKVGDFVEYNLHRLPEIFNSMWTHLRDYYFELGCSPNEKVALFGIDFLKQTINKLMRKKEATPFQKDFFKTYESIFNYTELQSIKQFIISSINSLCIHNAAQLKHGWKIILSIMTTSLEGYQTAEIKNKSFQTLNKIVESNLQALEDYYIDLTDTVGKLTRQKDEQLVAGCIHLVKQLIEYNNNKLGIKPRTPNPNVDISFLQATWLPLLNILPPVCGDHRPAIQSQAFSYLFQLLMDYGTIFPYEFWKMVFQGVIRPTFDEILFTFQQKNSQSSKGVMTWLKGSCQRLFQHISELISMYYEEFRQFLPDIFKIYENCTQHANQMLTESSLNAVRMLISKVAHKFQTEDWQHFLQFYNRMFKKTMPLELLSLKAWKQSKDKTQSHQTDSYGIKCFSQLLLLGVAEDVLEKFAANLTDKHLQYLSDIIHGSYELSRDFNRNIDLRNQLWTEGLISDMKNLPGLLRQERQSLKCFILVQYYQYQLAENDQPAKFDKYIKTVLEVLNMYVTKHQQLSIVMESELQRIEAEREAANLRMLVRDFLVQQLLENGVSSLAQYREQFFKIFLEMLKYSSANRKPCSMCKKCETCVKNNETESEFDENINKLIIGLFDLKS